MFDERGSEVGNPPYKTATQDNEAPSDFVVQLSPLEEKAKMFLHKVLTQEGVRSKLIFLETIENPLQILQAAVDYSQIVMTIEQDISGVFTIKIDNEEIAKGTYPTKQLAKNGLAEEAMKILRKDCFYIIKKSVYENVTVNPTVESPKEETLFEGSKAHKMMLNMGWKGKGLGINEQGSERTVAETIDQNISRQGLGSDNVFKRIHQLLEEYSRSERMCLLKFEPDFSAEERAHIHKIASKFGLKSKSEGKGDQRRITIMKKLHRADLVYNLLINNLENSLYKLILPEKFEELWLNCDD
ncbi:hypothetical protein ABEB36_013282 [Hypothenemus hampei]|uniref:NF-kappa-B-repressing factor n=1 Tax=Hypothenemus hampei TaxID=57062 RepID=A0ABD1E7Q0_HYPHA